mmetsp:Transcript_8073/g.12430  ORF Transcript_8073/g.12430 Transcript_8073/m.12430 type:complete len:98 (-) Transcript_8073:236-529(-)
MLKPLLEVNSNAQKLNAFQATVAVPKQKGITAAKFVAPGSLDKTMQNSMAQMKKQMTLPKANVKPPSAGDTTTLNINEALSDYDIKQYGNLRGNRCP